jgi:Big-like domain-containing protein
MRHKATSLPRQLTIGVLAAAAAILSAGGGATQAATIAPSPGSTGGLYTLLTPTVQMAAHDAFGATVTSAIVGTTVHPWTKVTGSGATPTGSMYIYEWHNLTCSGTAVSVSAEPLANGVLDAYYLTYTGNVAGAAVSYRSHYLGNATYAAADSPCAGVTFSKGNPGVTLAIHNAAHHAVTSIAYGNAVHGFVTVTGSAATPTGTASISRFASADCSGIGTAIGPSALAGDGTLDSSYQWTFPGPGTWSFRAYYQGSSVYNAKASTCVTFTVTKATPTFTTALHDASHTTPDFLLVGQEIHAAALLTSVVGTPTGTVTIKRYADGTCTAIEALPVITAAPNMDPAGPAYTTPTPLTRSYRLIYSGDSLFSAVNGPCMAMQWRATPTVAATLHDAGHKVVTSVYVGSPIHLDTTVTGGFGTPTGQVTFRVSNGNDCDNPKSFGSKSLSGGTVDSAAKDYVPASAGTYSFEAVYAGDSTYVARISSCSVLTVTAAPQPTATPKPTATPVAQPTAEPTAQPIESAAPSAASTGDPAASETPPSPAVQAAASAASTGASVGGPASTGDPSPVAATDGSGPGPGFLTVGLLLLLIVAFIVARWVRRARRG